MIRDQEVDQLARSQISTCIAILELEPNLDPLRGN